ncbi:MAG TPA: hypothetical protein VFB58_15405 [Chloroflexota bacterium]|nr:hypothetical protein [Chloroflexota bacterium]
MFRALSVFAVLAALPLGAASAAGRIQFLKMEKSPVVYDVLYRWGQVTPGPGGAYGPNISDSRSGWLLEEQRYGDTDVIDGTLRRQPGLIAEGLSMFHFGLAREASNGSFPGAAWPFHGAAMFMSQAAPALIVLSASRYRARFESEIRWEIARMVRASYYMVRSVGGAPRLDDPAKNHRYYEAALALGAVSLLGKDRTLRSWSERYARRGIEMERPDGIMPENGGHDSGYQALGMISAARYLTLVARGGLARTLHTALARGEAWELSRVRPDGSIDQAGDTRSAGCAERGPDGACKTVMYAPIYGALARWSAISGDPRYAQAAEQVWRRSGYSG